MRRRRGKDAVRRGRIVGWGGADHSRWAAVTNSNDNDDARIILSIDIERKGGHCRRDQGDCFVRQEDERWDEGARNEGVETRIDGMEMCRGYEGMI